jgi:adenylate cyclase
MKRTTRNLLSRQPADFTWNTLNSALICTWALLGAIATAINLGTAQSMERQSQVLFFRLRGTVTPPSEIVILAMDQESLAQSEHYQANPDRYPELNAIQSWPWRRSAYATIVEKLMQAGARSVALDVLLIDPSSYGVEDDIKLQQVLQRYADRVILASSYEPSGTPEAGEMGQLITPNPLFQVSAAPRALINFLPDPDQQVYQLPQHFVDQVLQPQGLAEGVMPFAQVTLQSAALPPPATLRGMIYFYGPPTTFTRVPFWHVLDPTNWSFHLREQTFKDKIVLVGTTAEFFQDFIPTPFSVTMPGVELHANVLATLMQQRNIGVAIPNAGLRGWLILLAVLSTGWGLNRWVKRPVLQFLSFLGVAIAWGAVSYLSFTYGYLIVPTAVPVVAIALSGVSCLTTNTIHTQLEKYRLRQTLERYVAAPIVQEILSHHSADFQSLLKGRRVNAAVLFCDIRSFTTFSLQVEPEILVEQLNTYLNAMVEAILEAGGTVDKFIGDAIMAEFGSPISQGAKADGMNAIRAALKMRQALVDLQQYWQTVGQTVLFNGIGINYGEAIAGDIGSSRRREYALIGDAVNIASRVEGLTRKFWTDILITESLYELVKEEIEVVEIGAHLLKGRGENKVKLYSLISLKGEDQSLYHQIHEQLRSLSSFEEMNKT